MARAWNCGQNEKIAVTIQMKGWERWTLNNRIRSKSRISEMIFMRRIAKTWRHRTWNEIISNQLKIIEIEKHKKKTVWLVRVYSKNAREWGNKEGVRLTRTWEKGKISQNQSPRLDRFNDRINYIKSLNNIRRKLKNNS